MHMLLLNQRKILNEPGMYELMLKARIDIRYWGLAFKKNFAEMSELLESLE